jgi:hypothetical protein
VFNRNKLREHTYAQFVEPSWICPPSPAMSIMSGPDDEMCACCICAAAVTLERDDDREVW